MAAESLGPEDDVDSLFGDLESERPAAPSMHLAVTLRPDAARAAAQTSGVRVVPATTPLAIAQAPLPVVEPAPAPAVPPALAEALAVVSAARGVTGYVVHDADGARSVHGATDLRFADRAAYVARLAALVGDELGLEGLREVQVMGNQRRAAMFLARDGSSLAVLAAAEAEIDDLSRGRR